MRERDVSAVVHLELRTANLPRACGFYTQLFGWRAETIHHGNGTYVGLELGGVPPGGIEGGVVEDDSEPSLWLPYVEVTDVAETAERARDLGAREILAPREGPAGWRCVLSPPEGARIALWQPTGDRRPDPRRS